MRAMHQIVYYIEGDGIGPEIWQASRPVLDAAVEKTYSGQRRLEWRELQAGEKALAETGRLLPEETLRALQGARYAIKGPLATPVGTGFRSLNVTLRQTLDLYACIRPIRYFQGIASPLRHPEKVNMVVFRENTEDLYMGIEFRSRSPEARRLIAFLRDELRAEIPEDAGLGIKPMTEAGTRRLVRRAIRYALETGRPSVTLMHKGNIMKFTEGAFRAWGYAVAREEFPDICVTEGEAPIGRILVKDVIADALFQSALLYPERFSVIAAPNLNGDYISDALAAQVGGLGIAPGVNMSDSLSFYEATHGTAPDNAGRDRANPCSFLLSGAMMLADMGWVEAARKIETAVERVIARGTVTADLAAQMESATPVGCRQFGELLGEALS
jgi:isocitrate dehydrogenase